MEIGVTGGAGRIGRSVLADLQSHGYRTRSVDVGRGARSDDQYRRADLRELWQTVDALEGVEANVHLAGIGAPDGSTRYPGLAEQQSFTANTAATYTIFQTARELGIPHVVWASSETVMGCPFATVPPDFLPLTEQHPVRPEYGYALAKAVGEQAAEYAVRTWGLDVTTLRFSVVMDDYHDLPRWWDRPAEGAWNLWSYVDLRDVVTSCRCAVETRPGGAQTFIIAAPDTIMDRPTAELQERWGPRLPLPADLPEFASLQSSDRAADILGFRPSNSWRSPRERATR
jgi:nucleoside-diphosphate-sugar epimerase